VKDFQVTKVSSFSKDCANRLVGYFEAFTRRFHFILLEDLGQNDYHWKTIQLKDVDKIPGDHKVMTTPEGRVFLIGGYLEKHHDTCHELNYEGRTLTQKASMQYERSAFGVVYLNDYIYVIGGAGKDGVLSSCERYTVSGDSWSPIESLPLGL